MRDLTRDRDAPKVHCPTCRTLVAWNESSPERPFCSRRCRLIDLGGWFEESHRIPGAPTDSEGFGEDDIPDGDRDGH